MRCFSALQRAEIAEMFLRAGMPGRTGTGFSALQRAEIAEIARMLGRIVNLFCFSALQRAEIAEIIIILPPVRLFFPFQCSSTSRNC